MYLLHEKGYLEIESCRKKESNKGDDDRVPDELVDAQEVVQEHAHTEVDHCLQ
jgi:hypothetical protein